MELHNIKYNYIKEDEFLSYIDWLTRFKSPIYNLLRVSEKIITKNCLEPKFNSKKAEELSLFKKINIAKYIWTESLKNILNTKNLNDTKLKDFLLFEEEQTFNKDYLKTQIRNTEYEEDTINDCYKKIRSDLFFPIDELVEYFSNKDNPPAFLQRLINKKYSTLSNQELFNAKADFASTKILFLVEGITEEKILPVFAKTIGMNFEQDGIKLKSAGGKTHLLKYYANIRKLLEIPVFILLDADGVDIIDELQNILETKDNVYLIEQGEIEDILPHQLIVKSINNYYSNLTSISLSDLDKDEPMTKILYNLYREKGLGEFHKAKFAQILQENIKSPDDLSGEIKKILNLIQSR